MKRLRHILEAGILFPLFIILRILPIDLGSKIMGCLARTLGRFINANSTAFKNLKLIFPEKSEKEIKSILKDMWENLGRMVGELPHINSMSHKEFKRRVRIVNPPKKTNKATLYVTSHYGNFEIAARIFNEVGVPVNLVYRTANNPYVDSLINRLRSTFGAKLITKGVAGVRKILEALERKESVALMIDQRTNTGIDVPFMGFSAKTTQLPANLALKYGIPVIFFRMSRIKGAYFEVEFSNPVHYAKPMKAAEIMENMGSKVAEWIKKDPKQWFWVHKRWGKL